MQTAELPRTVIAGPASARSAGLERFPESAASATRQERIAEQRLNSGLGSSPAREGREREIRTRRDTMCARQRGSEDFDIPGDGYCAGEEGSTSVRSGA
jgi:hypothetical protein